MTLVSQPTLDFQSVKVTFGCNFFSLEIIDNYIIIACGCNMEGVENGDPTCDKDGQCTCKCDVTGRKCDVCEVGHQGFPDCHGKLRLYHFESFNIKSPFFST